MNGVKEEIRHVLDSEMAKNDGKLTAHQMYEVVKKYEMYLARNKRLEGKGTSSSSGQQKTAGHTSGYKIPYPGVKAILDNAIMPITDRAEHRVRPNPDCQQVCQTEALGARPAKLATTNITDWKLEQKEDPILYQVVKHWKASREIFKEALLKVTEKKATTAYIKAKEQLIMKNGLLYRQSKQGPIEETVFQFVVPQRHRSAALDGCHHEAPNQGQCHSLSLMQE